MAMEVRSEIKEYRIKLILSDMLQDMGFEDVGFKKDAESIIHEMLKHNVNLASDTLVKASIFVAKGRYSAVTLEDLQKINQNGKGMDSWVTLIPVIKSVVQR